MPDIERLDKFFVMHDFENTVLNSWLDEWPLHCTIVPLFLPEKSMPQNDVIESVNQVASTFNAIQIEFGGKSNFGPNEDIPVIEIIDQNHSLRSLHNTLVFYLGNFSCQFIDKTYLLDNYSPHVTERSNSPRLTSPYELNSISIGKKSKKHDKKIIIAKLNLGV